MNSTSDQKASWVRAIYRLVTAAAVFATMPAYAEQVRDITIGLSSGSLTVGSLRIAKELGLYQKYGLNPKFVILESGNAALSALLGGSLEATVATPGDLIAAQARGQKVVSIANVYNGLAATLVLSRTVVDKLGVSPTAPVQDRFKALDGLLISLPSATANFTLAFKAAAQIAGVTPRTTYITAANMPAALESGAIQGLFTSAPFWTSPVVKGSGVVWLSGPKGEFPPDSVPASAATIQVTRQFAEANPDVVKGLSGVVADFAALVDQNPEAVKAATIKTFSNVDVPVVDLFLAYESSAWKTKKLTVADMIHEIAFVKASGVPLPQLDTLDPATLIFP